MHHTPPWDSWLGFFTEDASPPTEMSRSDYLVSWVPPLFLERVGKGVWTSPEQSIQWIEELDTALTRILAQSGLLSR